MHETQKAPTSDGKEFALRGELRLKNAILVRTREQLGMNQKEFASMFGIGLVQYNGYETLRIYPSRNHQRKLAAFCGVSVEQLFPIALLSYSHADTPRKYVTDALIEPSKLLSIKRREVLALPAPNEHAVEDEITADELRDTVAKCLAQLKPREELVVCMFFGIDCPKTELKDIATMLGLSVERVRQIKEKALIRLRHPVYNVLGDFVEGNWCGSDPRTGPALAEERQRKNVRRNRCG